MSLTPWEPSRLPRSTKISTKRIAAAPIVLFDGACNLCNGAVRFIIERDPRCLFRFASLQSPAGADLARHHGFPGDQLRTVALIDGGRIYTRSSAALRIARRLSGPWKLLTLFAVVPRPLRDVVYDWIARNRYRWFGTAGTCRIPEPGLRDRFLE